MIEEHAVMGSRNLFYKMVGRRLFGAVTPDSWKVEARREERPDRADAAGASGRDPVARGVHSAGDNQLPCGGDRAQTRVPTARPLLKELGFLIPKERGTAGAIIEILPEGEFVTYALGIPLSKMRHPAAARAHVSAA